MSHHRIPFLPIMALALFSLVCAPSSGIAQQPAAHAADGPVTLSLNFAGGTALDYIAALRKAQPDANIVVLGELGRIAMQPVQLTNVDVWSALRLLNELPQSQGDLSVKVRVENVATSQDVPDVFAVTADIRGRGPGEGPMQTSVISMADLLGENLKPGDAMTAIQTALELIMSDKQPAQIKFHEETGLLIARGSIEQIDTIRAVITQLRERQGTLEVRAQNEENQRRQNDQARMLTDNNVAAKAQNEKLTREVAEWRTKAELLQQSLDEMRRQMSNLEHELRQTQTDRSEMMRVIADLQAKAKEPKP